MCVREKYICKFPRLYLQPEVTSAFLCQDCLMPSPVPVLWNALFSLASSCLGGASIWWAAGGSCPNCSPHVVCGDTHCPAPLAEEVDPAADFVCHCKCDEARKPCPSVDCQCPSVTYVAFLIAVSCAAAGFLAGCTCAAGLRCAPQRAQRPATREPLAALLPEQTADRRLSGTLPLASRSPAGSGSASPSARPAEPDELAVWRPRSRGGR